MTYYDTSFVYRVGGRKLWLVNENRGSCSHAVATVDSEAQALAVAESLNMQARAAADLGKVVAR